MQRTIMKDYQIFRFDEFQIIDVDIVMPNLESKWSITYQSNALVSAQKSRGFRGKMCD